MAEQSRAVEVSHPPDAVLRMVNRVLPTVLRTPLPARVRNEFMVLNFTGRKTGRQYSVPVSAHHVDGDLYALAGATWTRNFRGGTQAQVLHDRKTTAMRGELIEDPATVADLYWRCAQSEGVKRAQRMMGMKFRDARIPTLDEFRETVEQDGLAAIRLTPDS